MWLVCWEDKRAEVCINLGFSYCLTNFTFIACLHFRRKRLLMRAQYDAKHNARILWIWVDTFLYQASLLLVPFFGCRIYFGINVTHHKE